MQQVQRLISLLLLLVAAVSGQALEVSEKEMMAEMNIFERATACNAIPCSGNATCENYSCAGGCVSDYCVTLEAETTAASASAAVPTPTMAANIAAGKDVASGLFVVAVGVAAAGLL